MAEKHEKQQIIRITTPAGRASYPWLIQPDTKFNPEGVFKVSLIMDKADPAVEALLEQIETLAQEAFDSAKAHLSDKKPKNWQIALKKLEKFEPFEDEYDDEGNETGNVIVSFKQAATIKDKSGNAKPYVIRFFDSKGKTIDKPTSLYGGSVLKINSQVASFYAGGLNKAGVTLRIAAVQIIKLVTSSGGGGSASDYGFGSEEGGFKAEDCPFDNSHAGEIPGGSSDF